MKGEVELAGGPAAASNIELLKWLNRYQRPAVHRNTLTNLDHELGFASTVYQTCLQLFGEMWKSFYKDRNRPQTWQARTRENLSRLALWGDLFDHGRLDTCLDRSTEIRDCVLKVFRDIGNTLIEGASKLEFYTTITHAGYIKELLKDLAMLLEKVDSILGVDDDSSSSSDTEASETEQTSTDPSITFDKDMRLHITCLVDLNPTLERMLKDTNLAGENSIVGPHGITFHITESAKQYVLQVHDKFRNAPKALVERLGEANWQRFIRIRNSMEKYEQEVATAKSAFAPVSKFHDSGLGSSAPSGSRATASVTSHSSFVSSQANLDTGKLRVPPTPEEVALGVPFECFICGLQQSKIKNRVDWKIHVFEDLQPYICTFDGCRNLLVTFSSRKLWSEHEFSEHRVDRFLKCHDCIEDFKNEGQFIEHLRHGHGNRASGSQLSVIVSAAKTSRPIPINSQQCPLCFQGGWTSQRNFATHVGRHMEDIALACLPKDADDNEESSDDEDILQAPRIRSGGETKIEEVRTFSQSEWVNLASPPLRASLVDSALPEEEFTIKCICIYPDDDGNIVYCESCDTWQHIECYFPNQNVPEVHFCSDCRPRKIDSKGANVRQRQSRERRNPLDMQPVVRKSQEQQQGSWTTQEDETLCDCRARGYAWVQIQEKHFQGRSANSCRKRYGNLMQCYLQQQEKGSVNKHGPGLVINKSIATSLQAKLADGNSSPSDTSSNPSMKQSNNRHSKPIASRTSPRPVELADYPWKETRQDYIPASADPTPSNTGSSETIDRNEMQKHSEAFPCPWCPKRFIRAHNLRSHVKTHVDERPFVCTICGNAYSRQQDRRRHEALHSVEENFVCRGKLESGGVWGCGREFARADQLEMHFRAGAGRICIMPLLIEEAAEQME